MELGFEYIFFGALLGLIPGFIARKKGYNFWLYWLCGAGIFPIALIWTLLMKENPIGMERYLSGRGLKKCPFCAEKIKADASVCKICGKDLPPPAQSPGPSSS